MPVLWYDIGYMKNLKINLVLFGIFFALATPAVATEGIARLGSKDGKAGSCFAASVYFEGRYRILMTCRGLVSALDPVRNKYVAWVKEGENFKKLGGVVSGKMQASMNQDFSGIVITVEKSNNVNKPSEEVLLSGNMEKIVFFDEQASTDIPQDLGINEVTEEEEVAPTPTAVVEETPGTSGSVFKILGKALLTGFVVLLGVVGVLSYVSRRRKN
jgi:hypothetical protein